MDADWVVLVAVLISATSFAMVLIVWCARKMPGDAHDEEQSARRDEERLRAELEKVQQRMQRLADRHLPATGSSHTGPKKQPGTTGGG